MTCCSELGPGLYGPIVIGGPFCCDIGGCPHNIEGMFRLPFVLLILEWPWRRSKEANKERIIKIEVDCDTTTTTTTIVLPDCMTDLARRLVFL